MSEIKIPFKHKGREYFIKVSGRIAADFVRTNGVQYSKNPGQFKLGGAMKGKSLQRALAQIGGLDVQPGRHVLRGRAAEPQEGSVYDFTIAAMAKPSDEV